MKKVQVQSGDFAVDSQPRAGPSKSQSPSRTTFDTVPGYCAPAFSVSDWTLKDLLQRSAKFKPVTRVSALLSPAAIEDAVRQHETRGEPLIIEGYHKHSAWPQDVFSIDWLLQKYGKQCMFCAFFMAVD